MMFLNPIGWLFLSLAPVVVVLYLRRVRRKAVTVPTLLFWQRAMGEQRHRAFLGKLRQWLSLLLQLIILLLLILALVRPEPARIAASGESTVIVLDTRARMQALEPGGESRFAKALALARQQAAGAREGGSVAILAAGPETRVVSPFSTDPAVLQERLQSLTPTDATGDLVPTLALAKELLATRPGVHRVLLLTDGSDAPENKHPSELEIVTVGTKRENVAITRFAARAQLASPQTADLLLSIANFGTQPAKGNVEISCDGTLLDVKPFALEPGERKSDVFPALPTGSGQGKLTARIDVEDSLALDNEARTLLPATKPSRVLLVTRGNWFLEKLFAADQTVQFELLEPDAFKPEMAGNFDAVVYDNCGPEDLEGGRGNALFLKSSPLGNAGILKDPLVTDSDADSPLLRFVEWRNVTFLRATEIAVPQREGWQFETPLRSFEHPLIVTGTRKDQRMAVFAFDVAESDLPLRIAFPLLISNTIHWLAGGNAESPRDLECGQFVALAADETAWRENDLPKPGQTNVPTQPQPPPTFGAFQPLRDGFYRVENAGTPEASRWLAVNTFSEAESDLGKAPSASVAPSVARLSLVNAAVVRPLWQWLAMAAFALLLVEWGLFHRRRTE